MRLLLFKFHKFIESGATLNHRLDEALRKFQHDDARLVGLHGAAESTDELLLRLHGFGFYAEAFGVGDEVHRMCEFAGNVPKLAYALWAGNFAMVVFAGRCKGDVYL